MKQRPDHIPKRDAKFKGEATKQELILVWAFVIFVFAACGLATYLTSNMH